MQVKLLGILFIQVIKGNVLETVLEGLGKLYGTAIYRSWLVQYRLFRTARGRLLVTFQTVLCS